MDPNDQNPQGPAGGPAEPASTPATPPTDAGGDIPGQGEITPPPPAQPIGEPGTETPVGGDDGSAPTQPVS